MRRLSFLSHPFTPLSLAVLFFTILSSLTIPIYAMDADNDGNPDTSDPNPSQVVAEDDTFFMAFSAQTAGQDQISVLDNDDFLAFSNDTDLTDLGTGSYVGSPVTPTNLNSFTVNTNTYTLGDSFTLDYLVCNTPTFVCATATATVEIVNVVTTVDDNVSGEIDSPVTIDILDNDIVYIGGFNGFDQALAYSSFSASISSFDPSSTE